MIVTRRDGNLHLVAQVEHARIAGQLAAAWGNSLFEPPRPAGAVRTAAARHDDGWRAWDARVLFNELERRPMHFLEIDPDEHVRLYRRGVEEVALGDVYAGVLVGMHWTGLYRGRWRSSQGVHLADEEHRWIAAKREAWTADEPRSMFETRLWHNYELLQLWDLLSLYLCVMPAEPASPDGPAVPWGPQLSSLDHQPQDVVLPSVRADPFWPALEITVRVVAPGVASLDPYPFGDGEISVDVVSTPIADRAWTRAAVARQVRATCPETTTWRIQSAR